MAAALVVSGCAPGARVTPLQEPTPPAQKADARDVLVHHCGRCHRSDLPTALPGALAVFDLTDDLWYAGLSQEQLDSALRRLRNLEDLDPRDLAVMEAFVTSAKPE
jgi:hypothetical protein